MKALFTRVLDRLGRQNVIVFTLLFIVSVLLVNLQTDATNASLSRTQPWQKTILRDYFLGTFGTAWGPDVPPIIFQARILIRGLLWAFGAVTSYQVSLSQVNMFIQVAFTWAALGLIYKAALALKLSIEWALIASLLAFAFVPWGFLFVGYGSSFPYDLPAFFFSAAGIAAIISGRYYGLAAVIVLGTINKETTAFLLPAYLIAEWPGGSQPRGPHLRRVFLLACLFAVSYETPRMLLQLSGAPMLLTMSDHAGDTPRWESNLRMLCGQGFISLTENTYWIAALHVPALAGFRLLPWRLKALYYAAPAFVVPIFLVGNINELRIFNEIIPLGALGTSFVLATWLKSSPGPAPEPAG